MSRQSPMAGLRLEIEGHDDPIILVRPMFYNAARMNLMGMKPGPAPDSVSEDDIESVEILITTEEGVSAYLQLNYEIFRELYDKMSVLVHESEEEPK